MSDTLWRDVDGYIGERMVGEDEALRQALSESRKAGLPAIAVSAAQGKMLHLLALLSGAKRVLEVGTLGGYSTIWLARALPEGGKVISLEIDPKHADVARANIAHAGLAAKAEVKTGAALDLLPKLQGPFDFSFIDADKENNAAYFDHAVRLSRKGAVIVVDNVVREGRVIDPNGNAMVQGVRKLFDQIKADRRVSATAIQTVGDKGYDGFLMAVVL